MPGIRLQTGDELHRFTEHRKDIQGLRAIAVISVVVYHTGLALPGGFVGVDIFFVISGYVISRLIAIEFDSESGFSMSRFVIRRVKRLLPILFVVVSVTNLLLLRFFSPFGEVQQAAMTAKWSSIFSANIGLFLDDTYIALVDNPFRHLWSLAVEEQFYAIFPVLFLLFLRAEHASIRKGDFARRMLGLVIFASFALCAAMSLSSMATMQKLSFFSMPTRMWQFLIGAVVMLIERSFRFGPSKALRFLSISSCIGLGWSIFALREWTSFPGLWAVVPTVATACLILSSVKGSFLSSVLSLRPLTMIGDISYGWYLWHWPIFVIIKRQFGTSIVPILIATVASLVLSWATFMIIEDPLKRVSLTGRQSLAIVLSTTIVLLGFSSVVIRLADASQARALNPSNSIGQVRVVNGLAPRDNLLTSRKVCNEADRTIQEIIHECSNSVATIRPSVLLLGDSHAGAVGDGLFAAGEELGVKVTGFFGFGCPIADGFGVTTREICDSSIRFSMNLAHQLKPDLVVIANSYVTYLTGEQPADELFPGLTIDQIDSGLNENIHALVSALQRRVEELSAIGAHVVILEEVPFAIMPNTRTEKEMWVHNQLREAVSREIRSRFDGAVGVSVVDASMELCGLSPTCAVDREGRLQYWHKTHLNKYGSLRLTSFWVDVLASDSTR